MILKQKTNLYYILIFLLVFNIGYTQQKTAYQKKVESLNIKLAQDLGATQLVKKYKGTGDIGSFLAMGEISKKLNTEKGLLLLLKYNEDVKNAEKLKTPEEKKRDKDKKDQEIALLKIKEQEQKDREENKIKEEEVRIHEAKILNEYYWSDYNQLSEYIKTDFEKWLEKSEFEKKENYQNRIVKNGSQAFDSICKKQINEYIKQKTGFYNSSTRVKSEINEYDPENESFKIKVKSQRNGSTYDYFIINDTLKVEVSKAKNIPIYTDIISYTEYKYISDWCFIENMLFPKKISIISSKNLYKSLITSSKNIKSFYFTTKDMDIKNEYISDIVYDYEKQQKKDQIDIENEKIRDNLKIYSAYDDYNTRSNLSKYLDADNAFLKNFEEKTKDLKIKGNSWKPLNFKINFVINADGSLSDVEINGIANGLDTTSYEPMPSKKQEASIIKALQEGDKLIPLAINNKNVRSKASITVNPQNLSLHRH